MTIRRWLAGWTLMLVAGGAMAIPTDSIYRADVVLTDAQSHRFRWAEQRGQPRIVSMLYTSCTFTCPTLVESVKVVLLALRPDERIRLGVTMISLDPKRDTPEALAKLQKERGLDPAHWTLARPQPRDVSTIAALLGIRYRVLSDGDFNHTTVLVLLDGEGRIVASTEKLGGVADAMFVAAVRKTLEAR